LKFAMASVQMDFGTTDPDGHRPRVRSGGGMSRS